MKDKLDFSLPDRKGGYGGGRGFTVLLLLVVAALGAANLYVGMRRGTGAAPVAAAMPAGQTRQLAEKLAGRNLYRRAAAVWREYLDAAAPAGPERAKILLEIGKLLEEDGSYDEAIEYFYRSEAAAKIDRLEPVINAHIKDCFERLGRFSALRYELMDRTSLENSGAVGREVVAEIGAEKITTADLAAEIERNIENQLVQYEPFMTAEQLNQQKKAMLEQFEGPEARRKFLEGYLAQEILYRQGLSEKVAERPEVKEQLDEAARGYISQYVMSRRLADRVNLTQTDIENHYKANKDDYVEPESAAISHILVEEEKQAEDLLKRLADGDDFADLAAEFSLDERTRQNGGRIESDVVRGSYVPGIGETPELNQRIFAGGAGQVLAEPFKTEKGWEIVKVEDKTAERQMTFEEVGDRVEMDLLRQKRREVQSEYIKMLMDEQDVVIHAAAFGGEEEAE